MLKLVKILCSIGVLLCLGATRAFACGGVIDSTSYPRGIEVGTMADGRTYLDLGFSYPDWLERSEAEVAGEHVAVTLYYRRGTVCMTPPAWPAAYVVLGSLQPGTYQLSIRKIPSNPSEHAGLPEDVQRTFQVQGNVDIAATQIPATSPVPLALMILGVAMFGAVSLRAIGR
jgi:hypothetical protein